MGRVYDPCCGSGGMFVQSAKFIENHGGNINKISGIGFKLDYLYGRGYYNNQATSLFNGSLYGYYLDDRYNMHAWISVNHMRSGENGRYRE